MEGTAIWRQTASLSDQITTFELLMDSESCAMMHWGRRYLGCAACLCSLGKKTTRSQYGNYHL